MIRMALRKKKSAESAFGGSKKPHEKFKEHLFQAEAIHGGFASISKTKKNTNQKPTVNNHT